MTPGDWVFMTYLGTGLGVALWIENKDRDPLGCLGFSVVLFLWPMIVVAECVSRLLNRWWKP